MWHIQGDALETAHRYEWDLMVAFPPCTYLSSVSAGHWSRFRKQGLQQHAAAFFRALYHAPIPRIAIENPVGWMNTNWSKPDQIIQPWWFGDPWTKRTCLWLKGLPPLEPTKIVTPKGAWVGGQKSIGRIYRTKAEMEAMGHVWQAHRSQRSLTFKGIAKAMAEQWG